MCPTLTGVIAGAAHGLAVHGDRRQRAIAIASDPAGQPGTDRGIQAIAVEVLQQAPQGGLVRCPIQATAAIQARPEQGEHPLRRVRGPLADRGKRTRTGYHRARGDQQDRCQRMTYSTTIPRVRHHPGGVESITGPTTQVGQLVQRGRDRGRYNSRHGTLA